MNTVYINARCREIIQILLDSHSYLTLSQLSDDLNVSRRSIYYDLCRINEWLVKNELPEIEVIRGKGILLDEQMREEIKRCLEEGDTEDVYVYSPTERVHIIICSIIYSSAPVNIDQLVEYCKVSRNTLFNDLHVVVNLLQKYDLNLEYKSKTGYKIAGDTIRMRAVFLLNFKELQTLYNNGVISFMDKEKIEHYQETLKQVEAELGTEYIPANREALAVLLPIMERGDKNLYFNDLNKQEIENRKEYKAVEKFFPQLIEKEKIYLCLHLLGGRVVNFTDDFFKENANQTVYEISKALVSEFERVACVVFERREELERQLFVHISSSMYRFQYGIQYYDSINEDIIREYPDIFEITKIVSRYLAKMVGLPISDKEVAYLALHFGSFLSVDHRKSDKERVLIVCANGISTGNMLKREIKKLFPSVEIVGVRSATTIKNAQNICDVIVSTVKMRSVVPVIQVHPILTGRDKEILYHNLNLRDSENYINANDIFSIVKPYIRKESHAKVQEKIENYLYYGKSEGQTLNKNRKMSLMEILTLQKIEIHCDTYSWTQALWLTGEYLLDSNSIEPGYIESIIHQLRYYGPYMFITPRVILAHSKPEDGVNRLDCSIHFFKKSVDFSENNKAGVIVMLAAENQESHLKALRDVVTIFEDNQHVDAIIQKESATEIYNYLKDLLSAEEIN